mgnify:FL=1
MNENELKIAFAFLLSMPGAPFIYYGDEIGMKYIDNLESVEGGYDRTGSRSPMQWDNSTNAGFSCAPSEKLYIPVDISKERPTVEQQKADDNSLYNEIKKLIKIRKSYKSLQSKGEIEFICAEKHKYPFAYIRSFENEKILVILNPSNNKQDFNCNLTLKNTVYYFGEEITSDNGTISVPGTSAGFYLI